MANVIQSRLTFIKRTQGGKHPKALYKCSCGIEKEIFEYSVNKGTVISCGCYHKERTFKHGLRDHTLYSVWSKMKHRCDCESANKYYNYGGRGVIVCQEWANDFMSFFNWAIANGWQEGLQLDKDIIPKNKGIEAKLYSPETCCFVTPKVNNNSKRNNRYIEYNGEIKTITEWSEIYGVTVHALRRRIGKSNKVEDISVFRPARFKTPNGVKKINHDG